MCPRRRIAVALEYLGSPATGRTASPQLPSGRGTLTLSTRDTILNGSDWYGKDSGCGTRLLSTSRSSRHQARKQIIGRRSDIAGLPGDMDRFSTSIAYEAEIPKHHSNCSGT